MSERREDANGAVGGPIGTGHKPDNSITSASDLVVGRIQQLTVSGSGKNVMRESTGSTSSPASPNGESDAEHLARLRSAVTRHQRLPRAERKWLSDYADRLETEAWEAREVLRRG